MQIVNLEAELLVAVVVGLGACQYGTLLALRLQVGVYVHVVQVVGYVVVVVQCPGQIGYGRLQRREVHVDYGIHQRGGETDAVSLLVLDVALVEEHTQAVLAEVSVHVGLGELVERSGPVAHVDAVVKQRSAFVEVERHGVGVGHRCGESVQVEVARYDRVALYVSPYRVYGYARRRQELADKTATGGVDVKLELRQRMLDVRHRYVSTVYLSGDGVGGGYERIHHVFHACGTLEVQVGEVGVHIEHRGEFIGL